MTPDRPIFEEAKWPTPAEAYLARDGELVPLARVRTSPGAEAAMADPKVRAIMGQIASNAPTLAAVASAARAVAAGVRAPDGYQPDFPDVETIERLRRDSEAWRSQLVFLRRLAPSADDFCARGPDRVTPPASRED